MSYIRDIFLDFRDSFDGKQTIKTTKPKNTNTSEILSVLKVIQERVDLMSSKLDTLQEEVTRTQSLHESAVQSINKFIEEVRVISEQLSQKTIEAQTATADLEKISELAEKLKLSNDSLVAALNNAPATPQQ